MTNVDLYNDAANVISSDEYSSEEEDLMNAAVSSIPSPKTKNFALPSVKVTTTVYKTPKIKEQQMKLLLKTIKFANTSKKKSVKWFINRQKREKYKKIIKKISTSKAQLKSQSEGLISCSTLSTSPSTSVKRVETETTAPNTIGLDLNTVTLDEATIAEEISLKETPSPVIFKYQFHDESETKRRIFCESTKYEYNFPENHIPSDYTVHKIGSEKAIPLDETLVQNEMVINEKIVSDITDQIPKNKSRDQRLDPIYTRGAIQNDIVSLPKELKDKVLIQDCAMEEEDPVKLSSSLYKEINEMYPRYNEVVAHYLRSTNRSFEALEANISRILLELQTLEELLQTKELEWNKLLHLKKLKEEILTRLVRKKHLYESNEKQSSQQQKLTLLELKELEIFLNDSYQSNENVTSRIKNNKSPKLKVENFPGNQNQLNNEQLQKIHQKNESGQTSFSKEISPVTIQKSQQYNNVLPIVPKTILLHPSSQYLETTQFGRQGPVKDVQSIIADYRQQNPNLLPRVGKRCKQFTSTNKSPCKDIFVDYAKETMETTPLEGSDNKFTPTLSQLLKHSRTADTRTLKRLTPYSLGVKYNQTHCSSQKNFYKYNSKESNEGVSNVSTISPKESRHRNYNSTDQLRGAHAGFHTEDLYLQEAQEYENDLDKCEFETPLCQECKTYKARFVCAGCSNQWYCSRNCQIVAWDNHSDRCNE